MTARNPAQRALLHDIVAARAGVCVKIHCCQSSEILYRTK